MPRPVPKRRNPIKTKNSEPIPDLWALESESWPANQARPAAFSTTAAVTGRSTPQRAICRCQDRFRHRQKRATVPKRFCQWRKRNERCAKIRPTNKPLSFFFCQIFLWINPFYSAPADRFNKNRFAQIKPCSAARSRF